MASDSRDRLFRRAALEHAFARTTESDALSLTSFWSGHAFWLVTLSLVLTAGLASAVHVDVTRVEHAKPDRRSVLELLLATAGDS